MIGMIVLPGEASPEMHGLDSKLSSALLPLGDRPVLQHIIECLIVQEITTIHLIVSQAPEQVESLLGDGTRWGCAFHYHLAIDSAQPYRSLQIIPEIRTEPWVLIHSEFYPCVTLPLAEFSAPLAQPTFFYRRSEAASGSEAPASTLSHAWSGTILFPTSESINAIAACTRSELQSTLEQLYPSAHASSVAASDWIDVTSASALLETQDRVLSKNLNGLLLSGIEREPGVWISRNVMVHPTVEFKAPVYVGPDSRLNRGVKLGPNAVIGGECIIDSGTTVENSLVVARSYVGESLELDRNIVSQNLLLDTRLGTSVQVSEDFMIAALKQPQGRRVVVWLQSISALLLMVLLLPLFLLVVLFLRLTRRVRLTSRKVVHLPAIEQEINRTFSLSCIGEDAWDRTRPASWYTFTRQFLPGLSSVVAGRISFVGLPPRTSDEIRSLPEEWRALYLSGSAGLITEASVSEIEAEDITQRYLADAYYAAKKSVRYDLALACRYFFRIFTPAR